MVLCNKDVELLEKKKLNRNKINILFKIKVRVMFLNKFVIFFLLI